MARHRSIGVHPAASNCGPVEWLHAASIPRSRTRAPPVAGATIFRLPSFGACSSWTTHTPRVSVRSGITTTTTSPTVHSPWRQVTPSSPRRSCSSFQPPSPPAKWPPSPLHSRTPTGLPTERCSRPAACAEISSATEEEPAAPPPLALTTVFDASPSAPRSSSRRSIPPANGPSPQQTAHAIGWISSTQTAGRSEAVRASSMEARRGPWWVRTEFDEYMARTGRTFSGRWTGDIHCLSGHGPPHGWLTSWTPTGMASTEARPTQRGEIRISSISMRMAIPSFGSPRVPSARRVSRQIHQPRGFAGCRLAVTTARDLVGLRGAAPPPTTRHSSIRTETGSATPATFARISGTPRRKAARRCAH